MACVQPSSEIPGDVLVAARRDLARICAVPPTRRLRPISADGLVVGFYHPHHGPYGRQLGPMFVLPEFRGRGLALATYDREPGVLYSFVHERNVAAVRLMELARFKRFVTMPHAAFWLRD
jgi:GNAT superfamily N-acetyltransferase